MKKVILIVVLCCCMLLSACANPVEVMSGAVKSEQQYQEMKEYTSHFHVHSEEEMCAFALDCLERKYGREFVINKIYYEYERLSDNPNNPAMMLRTRACPVDEPDKICAVYVAEPNTFEDDFFTYRYYEDIKKIRRIICRR